MCLKKKMLAKIYQKKDENQNITMDRLRQWIESRDPKFKSNEEYLREEFTANLERGLKPFFLECEPFLHALKRDRAHLSGGFALQVVTGQFDAESDIDIYFDQDLDTCAEALAMELLIVGVGYVQISTLGMFALPINSDEPITMISPDCPHLSKVQYQHSTGKTIELIGRSKQSILDKVTKFIPPTWCGRDTIGHTQTDDMEEHPLSMKNGIPLYMRRFDFTVCCVAFTVNEDNTLQWIIPYIDDIIDGILAPTPALVAMPCFRELSESKTNEETQMKIDRTR